MLGELLRKVQLRKQALLSVLEIRGSLFLVGKRVSGFGFWSVEGSLHAWVLLSVSFWWGCICDTVVVQELLPWELVVWGACQHSRLWCSSAQKSAAAVLICLLWKRWPNAQLCLLRGKGIRFTAGNAWVIYRKRYLFKWFPKNIFTGTNISMYQDCSLAILELEQDTIYWMNNLLWMVCSSLLWHFLSNWLWQITR